MIELFRKTMRIKRELPGEPFQPPVFLTGCMRSGTTFMANLLTEHPELLHLEGELNSVWTKIGGLDCQQNRHYANREDVKPRFVANMAAYFERCYLEFARPKYATWRMINKLKKGSGGVKKSSEGFRLLNKSVHLINRVDYLLEMFPESKLILMVRPIEAQVNSLKLHFEKKEREGIYFRTPAEVKDSWITVGNKEESHWNIEALSRKWIQLNATAIRDLQKNNESSYFILNYEELLNKPLELVSAIYEFLGLRDQHLHLSDTTKDRKVFNTHTGGDPVNDWKTRLSDSEKATISKVKEEMAGDYQLIAKVARLS